MTETHRIAVIPGDGIGTEVVPEGLRVLNAVAAAFDLTFNFEHFDHSSADFYSKHGKMLPDNWFEELGGFDADRAREVLAGNVDFNIEDEEDELVAPTAIEQATPWEHAVTSESVARVTAHAS